MMTMLARIGLIFILGCVICSSADEVQSSNKDDTIYMHATKALPGGIGDIVTEHESGSTTDVRIAHFFHHTGSFLRNLQQ